MSVNKAILLGSLGKDPEIRTTQDGGEIGSLSIATSEKWKDKGTGETKEKTEWHKVTVFGSLVKVLRYLEKGSKIYLEGKIQTEKYTDNKTGTEKYSTKVIANTIVILKGKERGEIDKHSEAKGNGYQAQPEELDDTTPF